MTIDGKNIILKSLGDRKRDYAIFKTAESIINTLIKGVQTGYTFKMKIVYAHFPITVKVKDGHIHVENFQGERAARVSRIFGDTKVVPKGDDVIITGPVLTDVSQTVGHCSKTPKSKIKIIESSLTDFIFLRNSTRSKNRFQQRINPLILRTSLLPP